MTTETDMIDPFTLAHLQAFAERGTFEDERDAFLVWAGSQLEDDATLADLGWPAMLRAFRNQAS